MLNHAHSVGESVQFIPTDAPSFPALILEVLPKCYYRIGWADPNGEYLTKAVHTLQVHQL